MFVPLPCLVALLLPILIGLPAMGTPWKRRVRYTIAWITALPALLAVVLSMIAYGPGTPPFEVIAKMAYL